MINGSERINLINVKSPLLNITYKVKNIKTRLSNAAMSCDILCASHMKGLKNVVATAIGAILINPENVPSKVAPRLKLDAASARSLLCSITSLR